ncbi:pyrroline-5-carboxylate reductase [Clostridium acetobutylicum]|uniref:Pyrroline-5-carboxylate reductase n=1 Tax=Clostridium acetobutylicum (strain ATCC 824 / DSM 792 / JCM 1419 / IAM 19013 / LMG 5710 / NBRC 13948 / NRRL B-527 / VKM B-1787 / 2291 / W) TaxID=272562 RepID=Q97E64_CLOAB|nr:MULTISPECIES: pyrroline-5-carboxylate reductase [Clostridium]MCR6699603.1 pyrroline-5-carboxylate reductase [Escherichia coli]AAK81186.1 Pyrroline-5-carboxylate reductase [Clostridium acetobutylicum ATCC 824]ADZ22292.1 pyrroline-5-carboxylate reductase [Clostridium acetobutylicum EA 2018]AEI33539.1 pyrroline-5-carboxylate reductase [Clostridium acetobutylicum DSM 1731]AWV81144.1 pyrroline-5-carboxylate reductase [Clostridium acetobutylicum]
MDSKVGFIGCGNMAQAIIKGMVKAKVVPNENIIVSNPSNEKLEKISKECGVLTTNDNKQVALKADIIVLSVKPNKYEKVISEIKDLVQQSVIIVAIAAGVSIEKTRIMFKNSNIRVVRAMPNTPALVGEAMTAISPCEEIDKGELKNVTEIFESFGKCEVVDEALMNAVTGVSGSSPAYVYMFVEAMADAAVLNGMTREKAYKFAAQSVLGAAKMILETGEHPGKLKDDVCSPSGTTIEAVYALEKSGFRASVIAAVDACIKKSKLMSSK